MRILVYCPLAPTTPKVYGRTLTSLFNLAWGGEIDYLFGRKDHAPLDRASAYQEITDKYNWARLTALEGNYDALLTVEADMIVPELALERMTRVDADVVYGLYCSRHGRHQWLAYLRVREDGTGTPLNCDESYVRESWGRAVEVQGVGMGCTLIRRRVLEAIPFRVGDLDVANDWYFALDLRAHGYTQMADCGTVCGHIGIEDGGPCVFWPDPDAQGNYRVEHLTVPEPVTRKELYIDRPGLTKIYSVEARVL